MDRDIILKRLAFIKYLYGLGENQSHLPEPLSGCSILMFHDSIEMFLQLAKETLDAPRKEKNFEDYWDLIKECSYHYYNRWKPSVCLLFVYRRGEKLVISQLCNNSRFS